MAGKILNYYAGGNTARGFYSLYESNLQNLNKLFILKGGPGTGKSTLMKDVGNAFTEKGYHIEYLHCSSDNSSIDGVIIPAIKAGIVDGTAPHVIEPKAPGAIEEYVNLGVAWDTAKLAPLKDRILELTNKSSTAFHTAYSLFGEALRVHDEWEKIYIENMDFEKVNQFTIELTSKLFGEGGASGSSVEKAPVWHRFLGAATPIGAVDYVQNLTEGLPKRYFIKGRPGSGKSTLLKKLVAHAEQNGLEVEVYHCGFDPNSLDMVIVRKLGFAIFDSTAPHEYFPSRDGDEIIDMYDRFITPGTDEKFHVEITEISARYKAKMEEAISYLAQAKAFHDELEAVYRPAMDFEEISRITAEIKAQLLNMID
ncbi:PRK06851 family protein [Bacillus sp. T3]|uniref:PRK06851 family protein n=1 Tax=Bacillus sp. T3 TaxID=467262 RepID=UPI0029823655|nr:PRK06851 family protein [Bacillus sp. T3]